MLRQAAIKRLFQVWGALSSPGDKEEETDMEEPELESRNMDGGNDHLKVKWFSEIPRCSVRRFWLIVASEGRHLRMNTDVAKRKF
jgi:hypothetical protein